MKSVFVIYLIAAAIFILAPLCFSVEEEKGHICFNTIDSNKDNRVTFEEFVKYLGDSHRLIRMKTVNLPMRSITNPLATALQSKSKKQTDVHLNSIRTWIFTGKLE